jgi:muconolactone delta-isomerase
VLFAVTMDVDLPPDMDDATKAENKRKFSGDSANPVGSKQLPLLGHKEGTRDDK